MTISTEQHFTSSPVYRGAKYYDERVCMSVRSYISKLHVQISRNFLCTLTVTVAGSSDDNAIRYVLPVLWTMSCVPRRIDSAGYPYTPFTRYIRLSNRLYNRFDNRLYTRYSRLSNRLYTRYNRLSNRFDNCFDNRIDNRLYRVNGALAAWHKLRISFIVSHRIVFD